MYSRVQTALMCLAGAGLLFTAAVLRINHAHVPDQLHVSNQPMVLVFQQTSAAYAPAERISAVRTVSLSAATLSDADITRLSSLIGSEHNPEVKVEVADAIGKVANVRSQGTTDVGRHEQEMLAALQTAFSEEAEPMVRAKIVSAAAAFNDSQAAELIARGEQDGSQEVRVAASTARKERDSRRLLAAQWPLSFKWK